MKKFLEEYIDGFSNLIDSTKGKVDDLLKVYDMLISASKKGNKINIVGNGGSSAIASHFAVDLTKNAKIRAVNYNEYDLITCFSNDYGYEHWIEKAVEYYGDEGDVFIGISSSGRSENIINGCISARKKNFSNIITFSGMDPNNPLTKLGDMNLWVDSSSYNYIENIHQFWLLAIVDLIIENSHNTG